jgi:hypothetical protein
VSQNSSNEAARQSLNDLRDLLLPLHKALIDSERAGYEETFGAIESPGRFLQLLTADPWFAWLRPFSQFITGIDEALDAEEPVTASVANAFFAQARALLRPDETGQGFGKHYFDALQREPDVVLAHAKVVKFKVF